MNSLTPREYKKNFKVPWFSTKSAQERVYHSRKKKTGHSTAMHRYKHPAKHSIQM